MCLMQLRAKELGVSPVTPASAWKGDSASRSLPTSGSVKPTAHSVGAFVASAEHQLV